MKYKLSVHTIWEKGKRDNQEDSIFPEHEIASGKDRLFILCDGMGGHEAGEVASATVCKTMSRSILDHCIVSEGSFTDLDLNNALEDAFEVLDGLEKNDVPSKKKMGTTMTLLKFHANGCTIAHIGDSRVYHIRPNYDGENAEILYVTSDHSLVNDLVKVGELTPEEAKYSPQKNVITRAMQPNMERRSKPDIYHTENIKAGDYFYLCSDGMLEQEEYDNRYIRNIFSKFCDNENVLTEVLRKATDQNSDNHTAIIVHILQVYPDNSELCDFSQKAEKKDNPIVRMDSVILKSVEEKNVVLKEKNSGDVKINTERENDSSEKYKEGMAVPRKTYSFMAILRQKGMIILVFALLFVLIGLCFVLFSSNSSSDFPQKIKDTMRIDTTHFVDSLKKQVLQQGNYFVPISANGT